MGTGSEQRVLQGKARALLRIVRSAVRWPMTSLPLSAPRSCETQTRETDAAADTGAPRSRERSLPYAHFAGGPDLPDDVVRRLLCSGRVRTVLRDGPGESGNVPPSIQTSHTMLRRPVGMAPAPTADTPCPSSPTGSSRRRAGVHLNVPARRAQPGAGRTASRVSSRIAVRRRRESQGSVLTACSARPSVTASTACAASVHRAVVS